MVGVVSVVSVVEGTVLVTVVGLSVVGGVATVTELSVVGGDVVSHDDISRIS